MIIINIILIIIIIIIMKRIYLHISRGLAKRLGYSDGEARAMISPSFDDKPFLMYWPFSISIINLNPLSGPSEFELTI